MPPLRADRTNRKNAPETTITTMRLQDDIVAAMDAQVRARGFSGRGQLVEQVLAKWMRDNPVDEQPRIRLRGILS